MIRRVVAAAVPAAAIAGAIIVGGTVGATVSPSAPELFLRPRGFFVAPGAAITLPVFHGSFAASEHPVAVARIVDLSRLGPGGRTAIARTSWTDRAPRSTVRVAFDVPGTYVVGLAVAGQAAKALIAVTDQAGHLAPAPRDRASAALTPLDYTAEIVPLVDPYAVGVGGTIVVRALAGGRPLAGAAIHAGGTIGTSTASMPVQALTTDRDGLATVRLTHDGHWFVALAHDGHRATLTFGVLPAGAR